MSLLNSVIDYRKKSVVYKFSNFFLCFFDGTQMKHQLYQPLLMKSVKNGQKWQKLKIFQGGGLGKKLEIKKWRLTFQNRNINQTSTAVAKTSTKHQPKNGKLIEMLRKIYRNFLEPRLKN